MATARLDPDLGIRIIGSRRLRYSEAADPDDDRPDHVRAASGLAFVGGRLAVIQDDAAFIATVWRDEVGAIILPRGVGGRRRFEVALDNKHDKLDLEACVVLGGELVALGSGSTTPRELLVVVRCDGTVRVLQAATLYGRVRDELGGAINLEGAAVVGDELWLFHRGNTGPTDRAAIVRLPRPAFERWLAADGPLPHVTGSKPYQLGALAGARLGFTDAVGAGHRAYYLACAEVSPDAVADGPVLGSQLGVIDGDDVRAAVLVGADGGPIKAEGLALDPANERHAWIAIDPDDVDHPAELLEVELVGPW